MPTLTLLMKNLKIFMLCIQQARDRMLLIKIEVHREPFISSYTINPLRHRKKNFDNITSYRWNRSTNLTNYRVARHLSTRVGAFRQLCDWSTYAWSVNKAGLADYFRYIFLNDFAIDFMNLELFLNLWNNRIERGMKKEYIKKNIQRSLILKVMIQYLILSYDIAQLVA